MRIARDLAFETSADERRLGDDQRHALALHVRAHQRAVRVIVLEERNQSRRDRDKLLRRDVHVVDLRRLHFEEVAAITNRDLLLREVPFASIVAFACATRKFSSRSPVR